MSEVNNNRILIEEAAAGTVLGRLDMTHSRTKQEGNRYMVIYRDRADGDGLEKALLNLRNFKVVSLNASWRSMRFQVLDTEITIYDTHLQEMPSGE